MGENNGRRVWQDGYYNRDIRDDGGIIRTSCYGCRQYDAPVCAKTEEDILYPVTGPVGFRCPLPKFERVEAGDAAE